MPKIKLNTNQFVNVFDKIQKCYIDINSCILCDVFIYQYIVLN